MFHLLAMDLHSHDSDDLETQLYGITHRDNLNEFFFDQSIQTRPDCRFRNPQLFGNRGIGKSSVFLQQTNYLAINFIDGSSFLLRSLFSKTPPLFIIHLWRLSYYVKFNFRSSEDRRKLIKAIDLKNEKR
jgi:hypothetical protein